MEPESLLTFSQKSAISSYDEPSQSCHALPSDFLKIHFKITLPTTPRSSKWSLSFEFHHQNRACTCLSPCVCYTPLPPHSSASDHLGSSKNILGNQEISENEILYILSVDDAWFRDNAVTVHK
jgi:hypothetical protein